MKFSFRKMLAAWLILAAVVVCGCGGSSSGSSTDSQAVDTQLKDDNNWQVMQTADQ
jgi:hypothetical protein